MYSKEDRMTLKYGSQTLHDTGCVSGGGSRSFTVDGSQQTVTIEVQPNCTGGTGTAWNFNVSCPK
jgi:hypothetical protein